MKLLQHQNIVKLHDVIHIPKKNTYCLVLEYIEGGELFEYIVSRQRLSEKEAARFFRQIISAIEYLHSNFIIHRGTCLASVFVNLFNLIHFFELMLRSETRESLVGFYEEH